MTEKVTFESKIVSFDELATRVAVLPHPVVMTNGVFDILHRGHATYLARAKAFGKSLVVAVNSDASVKTLGKGDDRPINPEADRAALVAALESVDLVVIFKESVPLNVLKAVKPDIYVKGADYENKPLPERDLVKTWGGEVKLVAFEHQTSTTKTLEKIRRSKS
ncbi:MAG TPA: D-glycero-beta-D-manno-heptose 1-phosphate adenylyltransferase [Sutterella sp.]|nr:D-glycero-beta-D-manno-heptose 1-phosphate adenylyltransferase [Sutterella sp.]